MQILCPLFPMFVLTAFVLFYLASLRLAAVKAGEIDPRFFRGYRGYEEPEPLRVASRHLVNHFETPTLFYAVCILIYVTDQTNVFLVFLAWIFVLARYVHSFVHLTTNKVILRFRVFVLSWLVLVMMWLALAITLLSG